MARKLASSMNVRQDDGSRKLYVKGHLESAMLPGDAEKIVNPVAWEEIPEPPKIVGAKPGAKEGVPKVSEAPKAKAKK